MPVLLPTILPRGYQFKSRENHQTPPLPARTRAGFQQALLRPVKPVRRTDPFFKVLELKNSTSTVPFLCSVVGMSGDFLISDFWKVILSM